jgi:hypothetical protein
VLGAQPEAVDCCASGKELCAARDRVAATTALWREDTSAAIRDQVCRRQTLPAAFVEDAEQFPRRHIFAAAWAGQSTACGLGAAYCTTPSRTDSFDGLFAAIGLHSTGAAAPTAQGQSV